MGITRPIARNLIRLLTAGHNKIPRRMGSETCSLLTESDNNESIYGHYTYSSNSCNPETEQEEILRTAGPEKKTRENRIK